MGRTWVLPASLAVSLCAATIPLAGPASAVCYEADCVPNVARNIMAGAPCRPGKFFNYGLDADGDTFVCNKIGVWTAAGPLIGVYNVALPCKIEGTSAQGSDGVAFQCADMGGGQLKWAHRVDTLE
ncbi:hypothetical protein H7J93_25645 [Mycobacterium barrassiae]|uniref:hypothetical protein n=1 Tax=Mycobacterium barrassiae TaxID=319709 RepID=UPI002265B128|nr:hypothetical protein [Mycobacterium barrassiae]MCV7303013.1 hypothetical protein [Mycobacterium barrassiae]